MARIVPVFLSPEKSDFTHRHIQADVVSTNISNMLDCKETLSAKSGSVQVSAGLGLYRVNLKLEYITDPNYSLKALEREKSATAVLTWRLTLCIIGFKALAPCGQTRPNLFPS